MAKPYETGDVQAKGVANVGRYLFGVNSQRECLWQLLLWHASPSNPTVWRMRISEISGFTIGQFKTVPA